MLTRAQLLAAGIPPGTISTRVRRGRLRRLLPQVYLAGRADPHTLLQAALLWLPDGAASHRTAAWLFGMLDQPRDLVEVTVAEESARRSTVPWLRLYRRRLPLATQMLVGDLPVVEPEQALLDCIAVMDDATAAALVDRALAGLIHPRQLRQRVLDNLGRRGNSAARRQLTLAAPGAVSHPERVLARAVRAAGLHGFRLNQPVHGFLADLLDRKLRLIIEVDGWSTHRDRATFQRDRTRQNVLVAAGFTVLRYTADDVAQRLPAVLAEVTAVTSSIRRRIAALPTAG